MKPLRLFYAIRLPDHLRERLMRAQGELGREWKLSNSSQMHLTLAFMGEVDEERLEEVKKAGRDAAALLPPFPVKFGPSGAFPNPHKARVIFIGVLSGYLSRLAADLLARLNPFVSDKRFAAHVTLGRARENTAPYRKIEVNGEWLVDRFELVKSTLTGNGAVHEVLAEFPLTGRD